MVTPGMSSTRIAPKSGFLAVDQTQTDELAKVKLDPDVPTVWDKTHRHFLP